MPLRPLVLAAVVGSALTFAVIGLMSMTQVLPAGQHVIVSYGPSPRDMVQIRDGTPYVVPAGRLFVLTGLGTNTNAGYQGGSFATLSLNGQQEVVGQASSDGGSYGAIGIGSIASVSPVPPGFTAPAGSTIAVSGSGGGSAGVGRAWGYLAND
jgi:hypothetical protein